MPSSTTNTWSPATSTCGSQPSRRSARHSSRPLARSFAISAWSCVGWLHDTDSSARPIVRSENPSLFACQTCRPVASSYAWISPTTDATTRSPEVATSGRRTERTPAICCCQRTCAASNRVSLSPSNVTGGHTFVTVSASVSMRWPASSKRCGPTGSAISPAGIDRRRITRPSSPTIALLIANGACEIGGPTATLVGGSGGAGGVLLHATITTSDDLTTSCRRGSTHALVDPRIAREVLLPLREPVVGLRCRGPAAAASRCR